MQYETNAARKESDMSKVQKEKPVAWKKDQQRKLVTWKQCNMEKLKHH